MKKEQPKKIFRVTLHITRALDYLVEAESEEQAHELMMLGEFDGDPVRDEGIDGGFEIVRITEED